MVTRLYCFFISLAQQRPWWAVPSGEEEEEPRVLDRLTMRAWCRQMMPSVVSW